MAMSNDLEKGSVNELERTRTAGGHIEDRAQPSLPVVHRKLANPSPLGLLSFATGIFVFSLYGVHARGITHPNMVITFLTFFGGICQFIVGIVEVFTGNTFGATVFTSYGAFNLSFAMIYYPGSGILAAYTDPQTGELTDEFNQALAIYLLAWMILTIIYAIGAMRSSLVLVVDLSILSLEFLLLSCGFFVGNNTLLIAGNSIGFVVAFLTYWAGMASLYNSDLTPFRIPVYDLTPSSS